MLGSVCGWTWISIGEEGHEDRKGRKAGECPGGSLVSKRAVGFSESGVRWSEGGVLEVKVPKGPGCQ